MNLTILTPQGTIYEGETSGVSLPGSAGHFEILNNHAPILSSLGKGKVRIKTNDQSTYYHIEHGYVECLENTINILVEEAEEVEE
jgi:F-type H+-transporting ATPase subunit epsilon